MGTGNLNSSRQDGVERALNALLTPAGIPPIFQFTPLVVDIEHCVEAGLGWSKSGGSFVV
ncbi:MAG TPA: hypothetical protein VL985_07305 [Stellaceae bacterium]|nr:hypothetical protein [Stellaceae bacterium]